MRTTESTKIDAQTKNQIEEAARALREFWDANPDLKALNAQERKLRADFEKASLVMFRAEAKCEVIETESSINIFYDGKSVPKMNKLKDYVENHPDRQEIYDNFVEFQKTAKISATDLKGVMKKLKIPGKVQTDIIEAIKENDGSSVTIKDVSE